MTEPLIGFALVGPDGGVLAQRNARDVFYAASTIKLGVLVAVLRQVDAGRLQLAQLLPSTVRFTSRIPGAGEFGFDPDEVDAGMPASGTPLTLEQTLRRMVVVSSNEATNMLVDMIGLEEVNATFASLGANDTSMTRLIGDYAARQAGFSHVSTAADLARLMWCIVQGQAAGERSTALMIDCLAAQEFPVIAAALPPGTHWGSKSGWVNLIHHDVAFIGVPGAALRVLAVCTRGLEVAAAQEAIRAIAALAVP